MPGMQLQSLQRNDVVTHTAVNDENAHHVGRDKGKKEVGVGRPMGPMGRQAAETLQKSYRVSRGG